MKSFKTFLGLALLLAALFLLWALFSTGGLYQLKQMNPDFPQPNRSLAFLISRFHADPSERDWDKQDVEWCSHFMPDWEKAERCFEARKRCKAVAPRNRYGSPDTFSAEFEACWDREEPFVGPVEYARLLRGFLRVSITLGILRILGPEHGDAISDPEDWKAYVAWEAENKWWIEPLSEWVARAE